MPQDDPAFLGRYAANAKNVSATTSDSSGWGVATVRFFRHGRAMNGFVMLSARSPRRSTGGLISDCR
jgi:hypothetical protein